MRRFIDKVWVDDTRVFARTRDGLVASYPFEGMFSYAGLCERTATEDAVCYIG